MGGVRRPCDQGLRDRILRGDSGVLEEVNQLLVGFRIDDEPRQHVLLWLNRAMREERRRLRLAEMADLPGYLQEIALRHAERLRTRELVQAQELTRIRGRDPTARGLSALEFEELVSLVRGEIRQHDEFSAHVFMSYVFGGQSYEAIADGLRRSYGGVKVSTLRACVARIRNDLRSLLDDYRNFGSSDFASDHRVESAGTAREAASPWPDVLSDGSAATGT